MHTLRILRAGLLATACGALFIGGAALAQDDANISEDVETVVVTGFRASLENTIALKKKTTEVVEAVSMEDIGKLPDQSIAESIARLPGLTSQRLNGRSQSISIRGMAPDFSTTLLNGREQVATSNNRSAQYDQYPSELMAGVVVYKTPTADLVGQGLSGTVDMRTIRPLDYDKRIITFNARGEAGSQGKFNPDMPMYGYRISGTYVDQYLGGRLGVTFGVARMVSPQQFMEYGDWGYTSVTDSDDNDTGYVASGGGKYRANTDLLTRNAAMLTVQYKPNAAWESTLDLFYTKYKDKISYSQIEFPLYSWGSDSYGTTVGLEDGYTVNSDGLVVSGTYSGGVKAVLREQVNHYNNDLWSIGWKNTYTSGIWQIFADVGYSSVQRHDSYWESYAGTGRSSDWGGSEETGATDTISFTHNSNDLPVFTHTLDYGDFDTIVLTAPQNWGSVTGGQDGYLKYRKIHDHMVTARLDGSAIFEGAPVNKVTIGAYYTNRHKELVPKEYYAELTADAESYAEDGTNTSLVIPEKYRRGTTSIFKKFGIERMILWDSEALLKDGYYTLYDRDDVEFSSNADILSQRWSVDEMTYTGYVKADFDFDFYDIPVKGNFGIQAVLTHQSSDGYAVSSSDDLWNVATPLHDGTNYGDFLPSINVSAWLSDDAVLKIGLARELVRARMDQMSVSNSYSYDAALASSTDLSDGTWSGTVGNARLRPWMADAADLSMEYYFAEGAYVALSGFYKLLENYIYQKNELYDFSGYEYSGDTPALTEGYVTQYVNGKGGNIEGLEFSMSLPGGLVHRMLDGFGVTFNASYTDSSIKQNGTTTTVPGLSKFVMNATLYYEKHGLSIRLNESYRSKFLGEVTGYAATLATNNIDEQGWLDGQIGYTMQSGPMKGATFLFQVNNITNQTQVQYKENADDKNDRSRVLDWQRYGTNFLFGISYKL